MACGPSTERFQGGARESGGVGSRRGSTGLAGGLVVAFLRVVLALGGVVGGVVVFAAVVVFGGVVGIFHVLFLVPPGLADVLPGSFHDSGVLSAGFRW